MRHACHWKIMHVFAHFAAPQLRPWSIPTKPPIQEVGGDFVAELLWDCADAGLTDELRHALAIGPETGQGTALRAVRDLVYELAGACNRDLAVDVLIYATGVAEFDLTSLRDYARKHGLTPEGFRQHVLKMQRRLGLPPRSMQQPHAN
jgi:hypothetical protein